MEVVYLSPDDLIPYSGNAKQHPPEQVERIANSIKAFGWQQPIVVDKDKTVIIGHGRLFAAKELLLDKVPVVFADNLTEDQVNALRLADNKTNESAWDFGKLEEEIAELSIAGFDMSQFGFTDPDDWTDAQTQVEEDDIPETPADPVAKRGDIWKLGDHLVMCGDSTSAEDISKLMGEDKARMLFTSPPYSDMREYEGGKDLSVSNLCQFIARYRPYTDYQCVNLGIQYKNHDINEYWNDYIKTARDSGYKLLSWNVWDKGEAGSIGNQKQFTPVRHEWIFIFGSEHFDTNLVDEKKSKPVKERESTTRRQADGSLRASTKGDQSKPYKKMESVFLLTPIKQQNLRDLHPAGFPVGLPAEYIKAMSDPGDIIIEPFGGSGTTLIACHQLSRKCRVMELEPKYVDVIIKRWEDFTRLKAELIRGDD